jgi:chaperone modulatory protein CbpM
VTRALARPRRYDLESFASATGLHPDLVRRFVALGLVDATRDAAGELWFSPAQLAAASRVQRLHAGLPLNYAAIGVVVELLDRIAELDAALRVATRTTTTRRTGGASWTRND